LSRKKDQTQNPTKYNKDQIPRLIALSQCTCISIILPGFQKGRASLQERGSWEWLQDPESKSALALCLDISWQVVKVTNHSCDAVSETSWHFRKNLTYEILCMSLW